MVEPINDGFKNPHRTEGERKDFFTETSKVDLGGMPPLFPTTVGVENVGNASITEGEPKGNGRDTLFMLKVHGTRFQFYPHNGREMEGKKTCPPPGSCCLHRSYIYIYILPVYL